MQKIPKKLGEILVTAGVVTEEQLLSALDLQNENKKPLGEILITQGYASREKLEAALARQHGSRLGEILIEDKNITFEQLRHALNIQKDTAQTLGDILIGLGHITEEILIVARSKQYGLTVVNLSEFNINPKAVDKIPLEVLKHYNVLPISMEGEFLKVAMYDPGDVLAMQDLRFLSGMNIRPVLVTRKEITSYLD